MTWREHRIAVAIGLEGMLATGYTREGERQLREGEVVQERAHDRVQLVAADGACCGGSWCS